MWKSLKTLSLVAGFIAIQGPALAGSITDIMSTPPLLNKAERAFDKGYHDRVVELLSGKLATFKTSAQGRAASLLCQSRVQLGDAEAALEACNMSISYTPVHWADLNARGGAYYSLGHYGKAAEDFAKAYELAPHNRQVKANLRIAERAAGRQHASN
ncbi:MAG: tetratricopeptide repeat protein [Sphingomonadales bacterium]|jgi:tetratricopeptide (TPR) repeat protein